MPFLIDGMYFAAGDRCGDPKSISQDCISISQDCRASDKLPAAVANLPEATIVDCLQGAVGQLHMEEEKNITGSCITQPQGGSTLAHVLINKLPEGRNVLYTTSLGDSYLYLVELSSMGCTLTLLNTLHTPNTDQVWMQHYPELVNWQSLSKEELCKETGSPCRLVVPDKAGLLHAEKKYLFTNGQPFVYKNKLWRFYTKDSKAAMAGLATTRAFKDLGFESMLMKEPECNVRYVEPKVGVSQFVLVASDGISALLQPNKDASTQLQTYLNEWYQSALKCKGLVIETFLKAVECNLPQLAAKEHKDLFKYCDDVCFFMVPLNIETLQKKPTAVCSSYVIADGHGFNGRAIAHGVVEKFPRILASKLSERHPELASSSSSSADNNTKSKSRIFIAKAAAHVGRFFHIHTNQENSSSSSSSSISSAPSSNQGMNMY